MKNGSLPTSIVVYRDGVGEGQISLVHKIEVKLLKVIFLLINFVLSVANVINCFQVACEQFYGPSSVPMAFIIVTKRISTRFFVNTRHGVQNPQPGTIIDSVVTDPTK